MREVFYYHCVNTDRLCAKAMGPNGIVRRIAFYPWFASVQEFKDYAERYFNGTPKQAGVST